MKRIIISLAIIPALCAVSYADTDGDFQYWNTESVSWEFIEGWTATLEEEFRFEDGGGDFSYQHSDIGVHYELLKGYIDLGMNYRLVFQESSGKWRDENRPHLNATAKFDLFGFNLSSRSRFEARFREKTSDGWRYRNKFTVKLPKFTAFEIRPYIADEVFVDFIKDKFTTNRLYGGVGFKVFKNLKADIFYLWQATQEKDGTWLDFNVLGTKLALKF